MKKVVFLSILIIVLVILTLLTRTLSRARIPAAKTPLKLEHWASESNSKSAALPELSESEKRRAGLSGPFPTDDKIPEPERNLGIVVNAWREAIVVKNIADINALGLSLQQSGDAAIPFLSQLSREDKDERVRAFAVRVLGRMRRAELASFFIGLLTNDASAFVRENAAWSLGEIRSAESLTALQEVAAKDTSEKVRLAAQQALQLIEPDRKE